jgi:hypothetical protein
MYRLSVLLSTCSGASANVCASMCHRAYVSYCSLVIRWFENLADDVHALFATPQKCLQALVYVLLCTCVVDVALSTNVQLGDAAPSRAACLWLSFMLVRFMHELTSILVYW